MRLLPAPPLVAPSLRAGRCAPPTLATVRTFSSSERLPSQCSSAQHDLRPGSCGRRRPAWRWTGGAACVSAAPSGGAGQMSEDIGAPTPARALSAPLTSTRKRALPDAIWRRGRARVPPQITTCCGSTRSSRRSGAAPTGSCGRPWTRRRGAFCHALPFRPGR